MITDKLLEERGYNKYKDYLYHSDGLYQKRITDEKGIKYFIDIYKYEPEVEAIETEYNVVLISDTENYNLEVTLYGIKDMTLDEIEEEVEKIWNSLGCKYYEED